ncbi:uncharacterized protein [Miscanthus floridulus]|uniref:uncharacterized protein n=1 Tax=Miscanthus floridulus TaxID=154761 RepID=UPI0034586B76
MRGSGGEGSGRRDGRPERRQAWVSSPIHTDKEKTADLWVPAGRLSFLRCFVQWLSVSVSMATQLATRGLPFASRGPPSCAASCSSCPPSSPQLGRRPSRRFRCSSPQVDAAAPPGKGGEYRPSFADDLLLAFFRSKMVEFNFGVLPPPLDTDKALKEPCLDICTNARRRRELGRNSSPDALSCPQV